MLTYQILTEDDSDADRVIDKTLAVMESAIALNQMWLKANPGDVCFLTCGSVKYDFARESLLSDTIPIKTVPILKSTRMGLCISFVAFDVAIRRMVGEKAFPAVRPTGKDSVFHILTAVEVDGEATFIDPTSEIIEHGGYRSAPSICKC